LVVNDTVPDDTIMQFKQWWAQQAPFSDVVGDAAFGSMGMINELKGSNTKSLFSVSTDAEPYL
jgi:hypothetical protein